MAREKRELSPAEKLLAKWAGEANGQPSIPDFDAEFSASFPNLWILMTWTVVGDLEKLPGQIGFQADGSAWKVTYRDPSANRMIGVVATSFLEGLRKLDQEVVRDDAPWSGGKKRKRGWKKLD